MPVAWRWQTETFDLFSTCHGLFQLCQAIFVKAQGLGADHTGRITNSYSIVRDVPCHNGPCAHIGTDPDTEARQDGRISANGGKISYINLSGHSTTTHQMHTVTKHTFMIKDSTCVEYALLSQTGEFVDYT